MVQFREISSRVKSPNFGYRAYRAHCVIGPVGIQFGWSLAIVIHDSDLKDDASSEKELVDVNIYCSSIIEVVGMRYGFIQLILFLYGVFLNINDLYSEGIVSLF